MISDPKTTPDARAGRIAFALLVAVGAAYVHFRLFRPNGFLWALVLASPLVPLIDLVFPAARYQWPSLPSRLLSPLTRFHWRTPMMRKTAVFLLALAALAHAAPPSPSAASTSPRPTPSSSTRPRRSCSCATATAR